MARSYGVRSAAARPIPAIVGARHAGDPTPNEATRWSPPCGRSRASDFDRWQERRCSGGLEGTLWDEEGGYPADSWVRNPAGSEYAPFSKENGALIYVKFGHLAG